MTAVEIAGIRIPSYKDIDPGWIPETNIILTETTRSNLRKILPLITRGQNILLIGDAGVGKNALIYYINSLRQHPTFRYSFNEDTLPEDLVGSYRIDPATHGFIWSDGPLAKALRQGGTFVADEMNLAPPEVLKRFISVFSERYLQILEGDSSTLVAAPGFNFVATQNPAEGFEGRKNLPREIQKYFSTVYMDPYPEEELIEILAGLSTGIPRIVLEAAVRINDKIEGMVVERTIGSRDLERYHFNLRSLNRLASRMAAGESYVYREICDLYMRPFRNHEDRKMIHDVIEEELTKAGVELHQDDEIEIQIDTESEKMQMGRSILDVASFRSSDSSASNADCNDSDPATFEERLKASFRYFAPVPSRLEVLESIARAVENQENILLESEADVEPEDYVRFFATVLGKKLSIVTLSRGMHTSDILGGLKPSAHADGHSDSEDPVVWVDGPLTRALRNGDFVLIQGLEAAGPELVEKMNMLMDDARALALPPESGENLPVRLKDNARIFAVKFFRYQRSTPSISRAFRNRFTSVIVYPIEDSESIQGIIRGHLGLEDKEGEALVTILDTFHRMLRDKARKREIGSASIAPYQFGLTNLRRLCEQIGWAVVEPENIEADKLETTLLEGAGLAYLNEIADAREREKMFDLLRHLIAGHDPETLKNDFDSVSKKKIVEKSTYSDRIWWDQKKHWREKNTGRAEWKLEGREIKKGIDINTPETGGSTKEGPDAWYGSDTRGNKGQGEPGHGGGGWGYRTEELYQEFLKKRKALWEYNIGVSLEDFKETFGAHIDKVTIDFDRLLDPEINITRRNMATGSRVDARKYLSYMSGKGDGRVFDRTTVEVDDDRLKGVEVLFALNKGRRIFNFEYSVATLVGLMSAAEIMNNHKIPFSVAGYSDLKNEKISIDLQWFHRFEESYGVNEEEALFHGITAGWHGDTVPEYQILESLQASFSPDTKTKILVILSDFRGARGRVSIKKDMQSHDTRNLYETVKTLEKRGLVMLGIGLGPRAIGDMIFSDYVHVAGENYANLPAMLSNSITGLIHRHHNAKAL